MNLNNKSILITGGTGSLGKALTRRIFEEYPNVKRLVIFSRDEQKQFVMAQEYPIEQYPAIRFFIGDVRDKERLVRAMNGIDYVIHTASPDPIKNDKNLVRLLKQSTLRVLKFSQKNKIKRVILTSSQPT